MYPALCSVTLFHESTDRIALIARRVKLPRPPLIDGSARVLAGTSELKRDDAIQGEQNGKRRGCCLLYVERERERKREKERESMCACPSECVRCFQLDSHRFERAAELARHRKIKEIYRMDMSRRTCWRFPLISL